MSNAYPLTPSQEKYILHWGSMGPQWGVNRTVAQVHALLYMADEPLSADTLTDTLGVARSNISTSLRELKDWGLIQSVPVLGQRKEHFTTPTDPWETMLQVLDERMKRELLPTIEHVKSCIAQGKADKDDGGHIQRMEELADMMQAFTGFYAAIRAMPRPAMTRVLKSSGKALSMISSKGK